MNKYVTFLILTCFLTKQLKMEQVPAEEETHVFQAEISRLLDIIINSLYTHKDIFIREIISNASDALDKVRYLSLQNPLVLEQEKNLEIKIIPDPVNNTLTVWDTGIGMNREDLINNLGTIARSGTTQFLEAMKNAESLNQIGQFGVGFYSYFLVASNITVVSRKANENEQWIWSSDAGSGFKIMKDSPENFIPRGTKIILKLKDDMREYLEKSKIKELIKKYSNYIGFGIFMEEEKSYSEEEPLSEQELQEQEEKEKKEQEEKAAQQQEAQDQEENKEEQKPKKTTKTVQKKRNEWTRQNQEKALWLKEIGKVDVKEYNDFYKGITGDYSDPLDYIHFKVEGGVEFTALLFIPKIMPFSYMMKQMNNEKQLASLKLFVRRVLISDDFKELLPSYFSFIKGVVDSDDLPLNVSRETLQQAKTLKVIQSRLVKKIIDKLTKYSKQDIDDEYLEEEEKMTDEELDELDKKIKKRKEEMVELYQQFWKQNGHNIKMGMVEDKDNRKLLAKISRWRTTFDNGEKFHGLDEYIQRKKENQTQIFYVSGGDLKVMQENPVLVGLKWKGFEVILCNEPMDEYVLKELDKYEEIQLTNIGQAGFQIPQDDKEAKLEKKIQSYYEPLTKWVKDLLKEEIDSVLLKSYSEEDAIVVVAADKGMSAHMQQLMKFQSQLTEEERQMQLGQQKKSLIMNPYHPLVKELLDRVQQGADKDTEDMLKMLYNIAVQRAGFEIQDQHTFQKIIQKIMKDQMGIQRNVNKVELDIETEETETQQEEKDQQESTQEESQQEEQQQETEEENLTEENVESFGEKEQETSEYQEEL